MRGDHVLQPAAGRRRGQAGNEQDRNLRGAGESAVHKGAGEHEAAGRGGQAAHRLRRAALHLSLHRQVHAGPRPVPGRLPHQQDRLKKSKERLDNAIEALALLCAPVEPPEGELEHIHYFCGNTEIKTDLEEREPQRAALYKATVALVRAYANVADELDRAGYDAADVTRIKDGLK